MSREIEGKINLKGLVTMKEKKVNMLRKMKRQKKNKVQNAKRRKTNCMSDQDQGKFYEHLRTILSCDTDTDSAKFKGFEKAEKKDISSLKRKILTISGSTFGKMNMKMT